MNHAAEGVGSEGLVSGSYPGRLNSTLSQADFNRLSEFVYRTAGINLVPSKRIMVETRLRSRIEETGLSSFHAYCNYVLRPGGEAEITPLLDRITTNKTDFFREPSHFAFVTSTAAPAMISLHGSGVRRPFAVWSAGCSSGEEPYTLAMVLNEFALDAMDGHFRFAIVATDLSMRMLDKAREGIFATSAAAPIPDPLRRRYLLRSKDRRPLVRVCPELRATIQFRQLNLLDSDYGFEGPLDLIFCRNVMIYFDKSIQQRVVSRFVSRLLPGGYLFVGHSESLNGLNTPMQSVAPSIYRKPA